jgi:Fe-S cluster assembly protein SufD
MTTAPSTSKMLDSLRGEFARQVQANQALASSPKWLADLRANAARDAEELGLPGSKDEAWKYTSTSAIAGSAFLPAAIESLAYDETAIRKASQQLRDAAGGAVAVLVDGHFVEALSDLGDQAGCRIDSLARLQREDPAQLEGLLGQCVSTPTHGFVALNTAFLQDGVVVRVSRNSKIAEPVCLLHWSTSSSSQPRVSQPRHLVVVEQGASITLIEHYAGVAGLAGVAGAGSLTNAVVEAVVEDAAFLGHIQILDEARDAFHVGRTQVRQGRDSVYDSTVVTIGGRLNRNEIAIELAGNGAECRLNGACVLGEGQHADHHTWVDHAVSHTNSIERYKGVFDGKSRGVFTGHVLIRPDAQKIDAQQSNRTLLLSDQAVVEARPQLEIYADDVKASHGATIGRLDEEQLFYMRSRGIGESQAKRLLTFAFADEPVANLEHEAVREAVSEIVLRKIEGLQSDVALTAQGPTVTEDLQ